MVSNSLKDTANIAKKFISELQSDSTKATVVALYGDLGSGKTTFTKSVAEALGISANEVTSPTFVIEKRFDIKNYKHFKKFIHIDAYRLEKPEEIERLDWKESLSHRENLIVIEWPENIGKALPKDAIELSFKFIDENKREIVFK